MDNIRIIDSAASTNTELAQIADTAPHGTVIAARTQTAGRGQRGNSWESEPGKNLTFSILLRPRSILASRQFEISQIVAISIAEVLRSQLDTDEIYIKWPNDIYYRDKKICGTLIECSLSYSNINHAIVGIGINVNQEVFTSDAPNPVSMIQIAGTPFDLRMLLDLVVYEIISRYDNYELSMNPTRLAARYRSMLWRADGFWPYRDNTTGEVFRARIACVAPDGYITLVTENGSIPRTFAFKQVSSILQ